MLILCENYILWKVDLVYHSKHMWLRKQMCTQNMLDQEIDYLQSSFYLSIRRPGFIPSKAHAKWFNGREGVGARPCLVPIHSHSNLFLLNLRPYREKNRLQIVWIREVTYVQFLALTLHHFIIKTQIYLPWNSFNPHQYSLLYSCNSSGFHSNGHNVNSSFK